MVDFLTNWGHDIDGALAVLLLLFLTYPKVQARDNEYGRWWLTVVAAIVAFGVTLSGIPALIVLVVAIVAAIVIFVCFYQQPQTNKPTIQSTGAAAPSSPPNITYLASSSTTNVASEARAVAEPAGIAGEVDKVGISPSGAKTGGGGKSDDNGSCA